MIDETVLAQLFDELGQGVTVPDDGAVRVVELLSVTRSTRRPPRATRVLLVAAVLMVVAGIGVAMHASSTGRESFTQASGSTRQQLDQGAAATPTTMATGIHAGIPGLPPNGDYRSEAPRRTADVGSTGPGSGSTSPPVDGAKIVKTGTLDLQVPEDQVKPTVNRVTGVAVGLGGYVSDSKTDYQSKTATAQVTIRVPVANFETATNRIGRLPGVDVLGDSENGTDVTAQYTDLQAQLTAATTERDSLLAILGNESNIPDILAVHDRLAAVNAHIDQLQGQINLLNDQTSLSSIAVTVTEKVPKQAAAAAAAKPPTGISKAWKDARQGFSDSIEWLIARSGGALIVLLAALALVFGIRYLYPVLRRALL